MLIRVINPNTTAGMTATVGEAARRVAAPGTKVVATQPDHGPVSIESHFDEAISAVGVLEEVMAGEREDADAYVIACFGDPGLLAARELTRAPVIGIAEAAFHMATLISTRFSVVTTLGRTGIIAEHLLEQYGFRHHCRRVRAAEIPVLDLEENGAAALNRIIDECHRARDQDNIGAIVLGCGGMADLTDEISEAVGLPVIEGVTAAVKLAESLVTLRLGTSKHGDLAFPRPKAFTGRFEHFSGLAPSGLPSTPNRD
ncbi:aspartate/glutamate racemase family protein [Halomonas campisalis]|uniref:Aspartate/glutamate racemase family protein n=1 Tax=Billgrantia campisalis TaxID=74661 RepID=A0ABS9PD40_9GAMM|nr:aspartate/glutamate racemase family protein [Halomonas campisalis]MCG6659167.1 aspartate/glutamate racemase family protein [Halomonas campisalis]MDR5863797.1 aspartate/glutamate racemase family protein [Halomonas campisalis]